MQYRRWRETGFQSSVDYPPVNWTRQLTANPVKGYSMSELQILQNKAAKVLLGHPPRSSSTEALRSLDLKSLSARSFFHRCIAIWLGKLILTLISSKIKLFIHITQDVPMLFVYPFLELTGVNKHLSIKLRKTRTVFQLIWKKHISYLLLNPSWKLS